MLGSDRTRASILVTGAGGAAGANLIRALRRADHPLRLVGVDCNRYHLAAADCDERHLLPPTEADPIAWIEALFPFAAVCDLVLPQPDCDVAALSRVAHLPEWRRLLALPSTGAIATAQDKLETALSLTAANVPVPLTFPYRTATVQDLGNTLGWPVWVRARHGAGSKGAFKAWTANQVRSWVDACALNKGIPEHEFTLSTYLPGPEYGCQLLYWHGHFIVSQTRERVEYLYGYLTPTGQSSSPAVARTVANAGIDHVADQAVRALDHEPHGVYGVDLKCDVNGIPHVTEVNAGRFYTTVDFLAAAGLNLPTMLWKLHNGESVPTLNHSPLAANQYWIRTADCLPRLIRAMDLEKEFAPCRASVPSLSPTH